MFFHVHNTNNIAISLLFMFYVCITLVITIMYYVHYFMYVLCFMFHTEREHSVQLQESLEGSKMFVTNQLLTLIAVA